MAGRVEPASLGTIWAGLKAAFPALPVLAVAAALLIAAPEWLQPRVSSWLIDYAGMPGWLLPIPVGALAAFPKGLFYGLVALQLAPRLGLTVFPRPADRWGGWTVWGLGLMVTAAIQYVLVAIASIFLLIPGLIVGCILYAALPAAALEKTDPRAALTRSSDLTQDYRFGIFGMQVALVLPLLLVVGIGLAVIGATTQGGIYGATQSVWFTQVFSPVLSAVYAIVAASTVTAFYVRRALRTSAGAQTVAEVFD